MISVGGFHSRPIRLQTLKRAIRIISITSRSTNLTGHLIILFAIIFSKCFLPSTFGSPEIGARGLFRLSSV